MPDDVGKISNLFSLTLLQDLFLHPPVGSGTKWLHFTWLWMQCFFLIYPPYSLRSLSGYTSPKVKNFQILSWAPYILLASFTRTSPRPADQFASIFTAQITSQTGRLRFSPLSSPVKLVGFNFHRSDHRLNRSASSQTTQTCSRRRCSVDTRLSGTSYGGITLDTHGNGHGPQH